MHGEPDCRQSPTQAAGGAHTVLHRSRLSTSHLPWSASPPSARERRAQVLAAMCRIRAEDACASRAAWVAPGLAGPDPRRFLAASTPGATAWTIAGPHLCADASAAARSSPCASDRSPARTGPPMSPCSRFTALGLAVVRWRQGCAVLALLGRGLRHRREHFCLALDVLVDSVDLFVCTDPTIEQPVVKRATGSFNDPLDHRRRLRDVAAHVGHEHADHHQVLAHPETAAPDAAGRPGDGPERHRRQRQAQGRPLGAAAEPGGRRFLARCTRRPSAAHAPRLRPGGRW